MAGSPCVFGKTVDDQTRCEHYSTELDIIAIRFACCDRYYPCHLCHSECTAHRAQQRPREQWHRKAILCGNCWIELTVEAYLGVSACPDCAAPFYPRCAAHADFHFSG